MRGAKRKIHFLPEFCKVISEPQWIYTAAHSHSSTFTASFLSRSASFEPCPFPSIICTAPKTAFPCSDHSALWVQPAGQLIPHPQDNGLACPHLSPTFCSKQDLTAVNHTGHLTLPPNFLFCFCSHQRELSLPSSCKLTWDLMLFHLIQVPQPGLSPTSIQSLSSIQFCHLFTHQFHHLLHISSRVPCP